MAVMLNADITLKQDQAITLPLNRTAVFRDKPLNAIDGQNNPSLTWNSQPIFFV
jgi:hypothetical protein